MNIYEAGLRYGLSMQQMRVMLRVWRGLSNKAIGAQLGLTPGTVKFYLQIIFRKVGVRDRAGLKELMA